MTSDSPITADFKQFRAETEAARASLSPHEVKEQERNLLRGVFEAWPELVAGLCEMTNELFRQQVVIAQAIDPTPLKVKAVRSDTLRVAVETQGVEGVLEVLRRVDHNNREILRRARALKADRDALATASQTAASQEGAPDAHSE